MKTVVSTFFFIFSVSLNSYCQFPTLTDLIYLHKSSALDIIDYFNQKQNTLRTYDINLMGSSNKTIYVFLDKNTIVPQIDDDCNSFGGCTRFNNFVRSYNESVKPLINISYGTTKPNVSKHTLFIFLIGMSESQYNSYKTNLKNNKNFTREMGDRTKIAPNGEILNDIYIDSRNNTKIELSISADSPKKYYLGVTGVTSY